ncbi:hypothetical protein PAESOLCIP111_03732 [Paenibacillus solanacearum]|uniref:Uncharacterized protein n=1 Tax=Paenibacillus solanacearum TaxID=2048548 RepID=A0A916K478_9BACL|nr:hypothetical protein [Paenibacillus solanacearum]CAG7636033.1 hypothetical protein PAESOLCIP111_03732 [Paenibacillus solanacearum]
MSYYCEKCKVLHADAELCPNYIEQIKKDPTLLSQAATFTNIAAQYRLVSSQDLQSVTNNVNKLVGSGLRYEGTQQLARDIQVFKRLNEEAYRQLGVFNNPAVAQNYLNNATPSQLTNLSAKLAGSGQEVDWLRLKQGELRSLIEKSTLLNKNAVGVDGETISRITGNTISRTTVKAAQTQGGLNTNVQGIVKAIKNGTLSPDDIVFGVDGTQKSLINKLSKEIAHANSIGDNEAVARLTTAQQRLTTTEFSNPTNVSDSVNRLKNKIGNGQATTAVTMEQALGKMAQGAIIGAAIGLTISSITSYMRYKNGELTAEQAFTEVGEDTLKSTIIGAGMAGLTLFLPGGAIGLIAGLAIGVYVNSVLTNILDEVFGKGAYLKILTSSGYILGVSKNLTEVIDIMSQNSIMTSKSLSETRTNMELTEKKIDNIKKMLEG